MAPRRKSERTWSVEELTCDVCGFVAKTRNQFTGHRGQHVRLGVADALPTTKSWITNPGILAAILCRQLRRRLRFAGRTCTNCGNNYLVKTGNVKSIFCPECRDSPMNLHRIRRYGLTSIQYEEIRIRQGNACGICRQPFISENSFNKRNVICIDHDHHTMKVRGLLCDSCNRILGLIEAVGMVADFQERVQKYLNGTAQEI